MAASTLENLAKSVLVLAVVGGMPDTFWQTDSRVRLACYALGWSVKEGKDWAEEAAGSWSPDI